MSANATTLRSFWNHSSLYKCNWKSTSCGECVMESCPLKQLCLREESSLRVMCVLCQGCRDWYSFMSKGSGTEVVYYYINYRNSPRLDGFLWRLPWQNFNFLTLKSLSQSYAMHGGWVIHSNLESLVSNAKMAKLQFHEIRTTQNHNVVLGLLASKMVTSSLADWYISLVWPMPLPNWDS